MRLRPGRRGNAESRPRVPGDFVRTETAADILRSPEWVRTLEGPQMTMIAGAPGVGKTSALHHFCAVQGYDALYCTVVCGEGKPSSLAVNLLRWWNVGANGLGLPTARRQIARYTGQGRVLVIDEAQHLERDGVEWLRGLAEEGRIDLILAGDLTLATQVAGMDQFLSRMIRPRIIACVTRGDVAAIAAGTGFDGRNAVNALHAVARMKGGLRNVEDVIRMAQAFAGRDVPNDGHPKAAIIGMMLLPKGADDAG